ncbi:MAG: ArsR family transcriptional regulator [Zetaproteobacteria bacterium CG_4_9_14_3_um_filter_49_83]|nr:MAG: ArsR family transcriptional regulator [Zetaproteobacteria bacterium CG1_02_49_23]PIQ31508.1 MAG: ArsR family transcriptional regulator [Zetaproteobacteria bacterium CG17_big_fil_post_rev_8_21_14_2_50_50_13]PIV29678.1 MAG: ArsR family transcriptional regulator [Zetaproteobacteria bacterium CG02_land_8_20_14_3_00_50_9]PIY54613.1 MAG: ArsR family transcriptional regulator [Zetaproteobacteria bacterium CG_4_10_14_0_8_um_filter_49_80]PJA35657.1 MAG: ArsR family transcriptional regulator [Zet
MAKSSPMLALDKVLHQPIRTQIAAYLASRGEATFTDLKNALALTDGNLDAHMKKLVQTGYIVSRKEGETVRPQTFYALSSEGKSAFDSYVKALSSILGIAS